MATLYSTLFVDTSALPVGLNAITAAVPANFVWVIRDIDMWNDNDRVYRALHGFYIQDANSAIIFGVAGGGVRYRKLYSWRGRQIMVTNDKIYSNVTETGWSCRISGYQLSLP